ncbi:MAG: pantetheine-phosphate adenylyltransferase [Ilumatobacteraceae bacterium]|nr:pantetheine-phosphate adenylyltransferase [Ilumatobacteraceae bacterium]
MSAVLYPGSFDPFHLGHLDVVEQATILFGEVIIGVMHNPEKSFATFSVEQRIAMIKESVRHLRSVSVQEFAGLAVDAAISAQALCIVKGLRTMSDFEVEQQMAQTNFTVSGVRTVYVPCSPALGFISSRFIREIAHYGGDTSAMVPNAVANVLQATYPPRSKK